MIQKERYAIFFLILLALFDEIFSMIFPVDFTYSSLSFVSHLCFCGCMLVVAKEKTLNRVLYACLCGLCVGLFFTSNELIKMVLYGLFGLIIGFFSTIMEKDHWVYFGVVFISMFCMDLCMFFGAKLTGYLTMSFFKWFIHVEALTLIFNGLAIFVLLYIITVFGRWATIKDVRFKRMEKLKFQNIKRK